MAVFQNTALDPSSPEGMAESIGKKIPQIPTKSSSENCAFSPMPTVLAGRLSWGRGSVWGKSLST